MNIDKIQLANVLQDYLLSSSQILKLGYPVERNGNVYVYNTKPKLEWYQNYKCNYETQTNEFTSERRRSASCSSYYPRTEAVSLGSTKYHMCDRCHKPFQTVDKEYSTFEECHYHPDKVIYTYNHDPIYNCCGMSTESPGCIVAAFHVWSGLKPGVNGPYNDYVRTLPLVSPCYNNDHGVFAIDCEMSYTVEGLELTRISVIDINRNLVYESYVLPDNPVVDFNTYFSGVTYEHMLYAKTLKQVQRDLLGIINDKSILIGHGLHNDLRALKLLHPRVIDTTHSFPHHKGFPYKRSLKSLAYSVLHRQIRNGFFGHCSYEDALTCMDLMLWKIQSDLVICR